MNVLDELEERVLKSNIAWLATFHMWMESCLRGTDQGHAHGQIRNMLDVKLGMRGQSPNPDESGRIKGLVEKLLPLTAHHQVIAYAYLLNRYEILGRSGDLDAPTVREINRLLLFCKDYFATAKIARP